jgi:16S rRNA (cytosine1402-N4)-methyltransferase
MGTDGPTAADLVNRSDPEELVRILRTYGEERRARAIVRALVRRREQRPLRRTAEVADTVREVLGTRSGDRIDPATRTFQALRIAVNDELGQIEAFVEPVVRALRPRGRAAFIAFHSLEDRIVKHVLRGLEGRCVCPPGLPECRCHPERVIRPLSRGAIRPDATEIDRNPRARSARLRIVERIGEA